MQRRDLRRSDIRALEQCGVVHARSRRALFAELRIGIPNRVEENEDRLDLELRRNREKVILATLTTLRLMLPQQIVQKDAHRIHAETFSPTESEIDPLWIERVGLPHLELIGRGSRVVVTTDDPRLLRIPVARLLLRPSLLRHEGDRKNNDRDDYLNELSQ